MIKRKCLVATLVVLLAFVLMTSVGMANGLGPVTKSTGKDAAALIPAFEMFPDTVYDSDSTKEYAGAKGKVNMIQPNGNVDVILAVSANGLTPGKTYVIFFDTNGVTKGNVGTAGPWINMGTFVADDYGKGEWNYTVPAGELRTGDYVYSVFINRADWRRTILISYNVEFSIE